MAKLIATVGALIICAGLDLLWQSRLQVRYWMETYAQFLSAMWRRQVSLPLSPAALLPRPGSMQVLLGLGFSLFLGPVLLLVSLTLFLYPR